MNLDTGKRWQVTLGTWNGEVHNLRDDIAEAKDIQGALMRYHRNVLADGEPRGENIIPWR